MNDPDSYLRLDVWAVKQRESLRAEIKAWVNGSWAIAAAGCSKRPSSAAAASEEARRTLRYVESLSDARTKLADFFQHPAKIWPASRSAADSLGRA